MVKVLWKPRGKSVTWVEESEIPNLLEKKVAVKKKTVKKKVMKDGY